MLGLCSNAEPQHCGADTALLDAGVTMDQWCGFGGHGEDGRRWGKVGLAWGEGGSGPGRV